MKTYKRKEDNVIFPWLQKHLQLQTTIVKLRVAGMEDASL
jgi:hypothetical protein